MDGLQFLDIGEQIVAHPTLSFIAKSLGGTWFAGAECARRAEREAALCSAWPSLVVGPSWQRAVLEDA